ncbi:MFS transporter [Streptomyces sp. NPDC057910]|uniref:MFS transporter n=1 Tax=Streptomyces sp. NPDC057910 TaxID=3346278 RepID=UPI0036E61655
MTIEPTARSLPREPLGEAHLRRLIAGQGLAAVVDALFLIWLTLFVLKLSEPGMATGFVLVAVALPRAALLLPAGVLVDRLGPAGIAAGAAWLRVAVLLALGALVTLTSPSVTAVALLAALLGVADAAYFPAALALLPVVVPTERLARVNALVQGAESGGDLIGPAVAAGVIAAVGFDATLGGDRGAGRAGRRRPQHAHPRDTEWRKHADPRDPERRTCRGLCRPGERRGGAAQHRACPRRGLELRLA